MRPSIRDLVKRYLEITETDKNKCNRKFWKRVSDWNRDMWRGIPVPRKVPPILIAPDNSLWAKVLGLDLRRYYDDPEVYLEAQLRMRLYHYEHFHDNTFFTKELFIWFGVVTELGILGSVLEFYSDKEGWMRGTLIQECEDLDRLEMPDFFRSGLMPKIHRYFEVLNEYSDGSLKVMFPEWVRGPFCLAAHLRGIEKFLMDLLLNERFAHRLMRYLVDSNKEWNQQRDRFLETTIRTCKMFNDEIEVPTISPSMYSEIVLPYETELAQHYGEVGYWHSCGDTTELIQHIKKLPNLRMFHCGPKTSLEEAVRSLDESVALDVCLHPQRDVYDATEEQIARRLIQISRTCAGRAYFVRADGLMPTESLDHALGRIRLWNDVAKRVQDEVGSPRR